MAEIIKFRFVPDAHIEECKFFYENGGEVETNYSLDIMRLLSNLCTSKGLQDTILQINNAGLEKFLEGKGYNIHVLLLDGYNMAQIMDKVEQYCDREVLFVFLVGPNVNVASMPVPPVKQGQLCVRIVEDFDQEIKILMLY